MLTHVCGVARGLRLFLMVRSTLSSFDLDLDLGVGGLRFGAIFGTGAGLFDSADSIDLDHFIYSELFYIER